MMMLPHMMNRVDDKMTFQKTFCVWFLDANSFGGKIVFFFPYPIFQRILALSDWIFRLPFFFPFRSLLSWLINQELGRAPLCVLVEGEMNPFFPFLCSSAWFGCHWALWHRLARLRVSDCAQLAYWTNMDWEMCQGMIQDVGEMSEYCAVIRNMEGHTQEDRDHRITQVGR